MTNKDFFTLLSPAGFFIVMVITAFFTSELIQNHLNPVKERESREKFDHFVKKVRSGEWQLTPDKMIESMQASHGVAEAEKQLCKTAGEMMKRFVWFSLFGIIFQIAVTLEVKKRLQQRKL